MNITSKQWFQIASAVISGLITGAALLTTLFGRDLALQIVAMLGIANIILSSIGTALSGQGSQVQDVLDMPGVERLRVNAKANPTLAAMAMNPAIDKISPTEESRFVVAQTAKAA